MRLCCRTGSWNIQSCGVKLVPCSSQPIVLPFEDNLCLVCLECGGIMDGYFHGILLSNRQVVGSYRVAVAVVELDVRAIPHRTGGAAPGGAIPLALSPPVDRVFIAHLEDIGGMTV